MPVARADRYAEPLPAGVVEWVAGRRSGGVPEQLPVVALPPRQVEGLVTQHARGRDVPGAEGDALVQQSAGRALYRAQGCRRRHRAGGEQRAKGRAHCVDVGKEALEELADLVDCGTRRQCLQGHWNSRVVLVRVVIAPCPLPWSRRTR